MNVAGVLPIIIFVLLILAVSTIFSFIASIVLLFLLAVRNWWIKKRGTK